VQVLAGGGPAAATVRPQAHVGLLGPAQRLDHAGGVAQQRAELGRGRVVEVAHGHHVLARPDDQRAEVHRPDHVVHRP
jgi:hypothetical protein